MTNGMDPEMLRLLEHQIGSVALMSGPQLSDITEYACR